MKRIALLSVLAAIILTSCESPRDDIAQVPATLAVLEGHTGWVNSVAWSPDGRTLASGSWDVIRLWDVASGEQLAVLEGHMGRVGSTVNSVAWSPDGRSLASGAFDNTIRLWDVASGEQLAVLEGDRNWYAPPEGHTSSVNSVAWSPDGRTLASGSNDKTVRPWDVASGEQVDVLAGGMGRGDSMVNSVAWSPDGRTLASGDGFTIRLWDVVSGQQVDMLVGPTDWVESVAWSPDGRTIASAGSDVIRLWDVASGEQLAVLDGRRDWWSPPEGHTGIVNSVAWSPDGRTLASGAGGQYDKTIRLWDVASGKQLAVLEGHTDGVNSVAWSPDGRTLASGSRDGTIRLWDVASGEQSES